MVGKSAGQEVNELGLELIQGIQKDQQGLFCGGQGKTPGKKLAQAVIGAQLLVVLTLQEESAQVGIVGPSNLGTDLPQ
jgi:hypothetical protein